MFRNNNKKSYEVEDLLLRLSALEVEQRRTNKEIDSLKALVHDLHNSHNTTRTDNQVTRAISSDTEVTTPTEVTSYIDKQHRDKRDRLSKPALAKSNKQQLTEAQVPAVSIKSSGNTHYLDRNGNTLHIGDKVYLLTRGVFKDRYGTVLRFGKNKNEVKRDRTGQEQTRVSHNLVLEQWK